MFEKHIEANRPVRIEEHPEGNYMVMMKFGHANTRWDSVFSGTIGACGEWVKENRKNRDLKLAQKREAVKQEVEAMTANTREGFRYFIETVCGGSDAAGGGCCDFL